MLKRLQKTLFPVTLALIGANSFSLAAEDNCVDSFEKIQAQKFNVHDLMDSPAQVNESYLTNLIQDPRASDPEHPEIFLKAFIETFVIRNAGTDMTQRTFGLFTQWMQDALSNTELINAVLKIEIEDSAQGKFASRILRNFENTYHRVYRFDSTSKNPFSGLHKEGNPLSNGEIETYEDLALKMVAKFMGNRHSSTARDLMNNAIQAQSMSTSTFAGLIKTHPELSRIYNEYVFRGDSWPTVPPSRREDVIRLRKESGPSVTIGDDVVGVFNYDQILDPRDQKWKYQIFIQVPPEGLDLNTRSSNGQLRKIRLDIPEQVSQETVLPKAYVTRTSPDYENWKKDGSLTGAIFADSSTTVHTAYIRYLRGEGYEFKETPIENFTDFLKNGIRDGSIDFLFREAHRSGEIHHLQSGTLIEATKTIHGTLRRVFVLLPGADASRSTIRMNALDELLATRQEASDSGRLLYFDSKCSSHSRLRSYREAICQSDLDITTVKGSSVEFQNWPSSAARALLHSILNEKPYSGIRADIDEARRLGAEEEDKDLLDYSDDIIVTPDEDRFAEIWKQTPPPPKPPKLNIEVIDESESRSLQTESIGPDEKHKGLRL